MWMCTSGFGPKSCWPLNEVFHWTHKFGSFHYLTNILELINWTNLLRGKTRYISRKINLVIGMQLEVFVNFLPSHCNCNYLLWNATKSHRNVDALRNNVGEICPKHLLFFLKCSLHQWVRKCPTTPTPKWLQLAVQKKSGNPTTKETQPKDDTLGKCTAATCPTGNEKQSKKQQWIRTRSSSNTKGA